MKPASENKEILIVHTWGIGDLILLTPVLNATHILFPDLKFTLVFFPKLAATPILNAPEVQNVLYTSWKTPDLFKTLIQLRRKKYYAAMFSSGVTPWKAWMYLLLLRAKHKIGEYHKHKYPLLTDHHKFDPDMTRTQANYELLREVLPFPDWKSALLSKADLHLSPSFQISAENILWADKYLRSNGLEGSQILAIHPGCMAKNKYRRWPQMSFISLIKLIEAKYPFRIVIIAGPDEIDVGHFLHEQTGHLLIKDILLADVAAFISRCALLINTDSSLGHVASCFNVPSLTIFGPGNELQTAPFSEESKIVRIPMKCAPCVGVRKRDCAAECLTNLPPEQVMNALKTILDNQQTPT